MSKKLKTLKKSFVLSLVVALVTTLLTASLTAHAAVPHYLGYEGYLTDTSDNAITNTYNLTFRIYDALAAGNLLWTETHSSVGVTNGYFSVQLGSVTALNLDFDIPYWISFEIVGDTEMTPRQPINSVAYSYMSDNTYALTDADLDTTIDASTDDQIDIAIAGADDFQFVANILKLLTGSSMETDTISETTSGSGVTIDDITLKDGGATVITGGTNTFNITNGTSSMDVATGSALNIDANLTVESASFINQDLTTDASVTFAGLSNTDTNITNVLDIALASISSDSSHISIAAADGTDILQIGDGTYVWGHTPMVGIEGILEVDGMAYFDGGFSTSGNLDMEGNDILNVDQITGNSTYITIGDVGAATGHGLAANDDLLVGGKLEVDGTAYFDSEITLAADRWLTVGSAYGSITPRNTLQTIDSPFLATGSVSNSWIMAEYADRATDFAHALQTNPTFFIQSADQTNIADWISLSHDQTDGVIDVGTGAVNFLDNVQVGDGTFSWGHAPQVGIEGKLEVDSYLYADNHLYVGTDIIFGSPATYGAFSKQADDGLHFYAGSGDGTGNNNIVITSGANYEKDHDHETLSVDPTVFIQSATDPDSDNTQWLSLSHDQTDGRIQTGAGNLSIGSGTQSHALTTPNDLFVSGEFEVDGDSFFDARAGFYHSTKHVDDVELYFGGALDSTIVWDTSQTPDALVLGVGAESNGFIITENADIGTAYNHALQDDPTLFIQSSDATAPSEWLSFAYSAANNRAEIEAGAGNIHFNSSIETGAYEFSEDAGFVAAMDMSVSATPAAGTQESYTFKIDGESFLKIYAEADSSGGIQNENIRFFKDISTGANDLALVPAAGQITIIGDTGSQDKMGTPTNDDLFVNGRLEVDGTSYFDGITIYEQTLAFDGFTSADSALTFSTVTDELGLWTGAGHGRALVISDRANLPHNHDHGVQTNPTLFIHSATDPDSDNTQWLSLTHDQTDGRIQTGAGNLSIGSGSDSHSLNTPNDLFVSGKLEVDGWVYPDAGIILANSIDLNFGTSQDTSLKYQSSQTPDSLMLGVSTESNGFIISELADMGYDFAHALQTDPTLFIQSANQSATEWISLTHDQTNAVIESGAGNIHFNSSIETGAYEYTEDGGFLSAMDMSVSATPAAGTQESYAFKIDGQSFIKIYSEADSSGSIQNESIKFYKPVVYLPSSDQTVADDAAVTCTDTITRVVGADADALLDTAPAINDGTEDGQFCILQGTNDSNLVTVADAVNTALAGGINFSMGVGDTLTVIWDAGDSLWYEVSRSDN